MLILSIVFEIWKSNRRGGKKERKKERKKHRITGNKKNIKVKNKKSHHYMMTFNYLLAKGGYVLGTVDLSVCLSVDNITQKVMNGLG